MSFAVPAVKATSVIYLKHNSSQGIKSQTHYGFMFPFQSLSTPAVYKIADQSLSQEVVILVFSWGSSTIVLSKMSSFDHIWWGHILIFTLIVMLLMQTECLNFCQNICASSINIQFLIILILHLRHWEFSELTWKIDEGISWTLMTRTCKYRFTYQAAIFKTSEVF